MLKRIINRLLECWGRHEWVDLGNGKLTCDGQVLMQCAKCFTTKSFPTYNQWSQKRFGKPEKKWAPDRIEIKNVYGQFPEGIVGDCIPQCLNCIEQKREGYRCICGNPRWCACYSDIQKFKKKLEENKNK